MSLSSSRNVIFDNFFTKINDKNSFWTSDYPAIIHQFLPTTSGVSDLPDIKQDKGDAMKKIVVAILLVLLAVPALAAKKKHPYKPVTEKEKTLYGVGLVLARQLEVFDLTPSELWVVRRGFTDATRGRKTKVNFATYSKKSQELATARRDAHGKKLAKLVPEFMAKESAKDGAVKTASGLIYQPLKEGEGATLAATDKIKVQYRSTLIDGKEMENTYKAAEPDEAVVNEFMKCLSEGLQLMKPSGKARLICPPELALGKEGNGVIPPDATLVFDVEVVEVVKENK